MSTEYTSDSENAEMRRRAAWLLGMLVLAAALLVVVVLVFFGGSGGSGTASGPTTLIVTTPTPAHPGTSRATLPSSTSRPAPSGDGSSGTAGPASCPTAAPCVLAGDPGGAIAAVNAYRTSHGRSAVSGSVSAAAQRCALSNGGDCDGSWASTFLGSPSGAAAVKKLVTRGHVLSKYSAFQVGWAYDPGGRRYFFALIRTG